MTLSTKHKIRLLRAIANHLSVEHISKLLDAHNKGDSSQSELMEELRIALAMPGHFTGSSDLMNSLLDQTKRTFSGGKPTNEAQSQALANTIHQRALNKLHLADYRARHTRLVQVSAIIDPRTTPHCRSMNGRIFALDDLISEDQNQSQLVRDNTYWESAGYFASTPTHEIIPSLPPYHFGCRTRIVPYPHAESYETFDTLKHTDPIYPTILKDKLANYSITPQNLDTVRTYAHQCQWFKKGDRDSLKDHYDKHAKHFSDGKRFDDQADYDRELRNLIKNPNSSITLRIEKNSLIMYVYERSPDSDEIRYEAVVINMDRLNVLTYSKKTEKQMSKITDRKYKEKNMSWELTKKKEIKDKKDPIKEALKLLVEFDVIETYEDTIRVIKEDDFDDMVLYAQDISDFRMEEVQTLADAGLLPEEDIKIIKKVDDFIRKNRVPYKYHDLQDWLKTNHL